MKERKTLHSLPGKVTGVEVARGGETAFVSVQVENGKHTHTIKIPCTIEQARALPLFSRVELAIIEAP